MVKRLYTKKIFCLAITIFVVANFLLVNVVSAKQLKIQAADVERIKTALGMAQTVATISDMIINNKDLATVLNTVISGGKTSVDITYGLVVLGTLNEMDLVDLVVSGRYRDEARQYFNSILDQTINLTSYWKNTSQNIFSLIRRGGTVTPITGLTMESVGILEKTMSIIISAKVWLTLETYNGMWRYFDERMNKESHQQAWSYAMLEMGRAERIEIKNNELFVAGKKSTRQKELQLEQQFFTLYNNWEPYVTPFGVSEKYKKQIKEELSSVLIAAAKESAVLAKNEQKPSLIDKLAQQLEKLKKETAVLLSRINPFRAGISLNLPEASEEPAEAELFGAELRTVEPPIIEITPEVEPIIENSDSEEKTAETELPGTELQLMEPSQMATSTVPDLPASTTEPVPVPEPEPEPEPLPTPIPEIEPAPGPIFCERDSGNPTRFRVLINEIAWMGTSNSTDDEWIELKNIWGIPVRLNGWQLFDKDKQIKIIFGENDIIPADGYYLLERTDDESIPNVKANLIYTGALSNSDESLYLFDDQCNIEDEILANPSWPAGDNSSKKPMTRLDFLNWYTGASTPAGENSPPPITRAIVQNPAPASAPLPISPAIFITETYIGSEGNEKDDFVELYNSDSESIDLTDWYLQRKTADSQDFSSYVAHELFTGKIIGGKDYFLIANASSTFATSADIVTENPLTENNALVLKNSQQDIIDEVSTDSPETNKSYGRKWSSTTLNYTEDFETQAPTPRTQNQNTTSADEVIESETESLSVIINEIAWAGTAANYFDEWIELLVNSTTTLDNWKILGSKNGTTTLEIALSGIASSSTYLLIERTDDNTISDTSADFFFTGNLDNDGMKLELLDSNDILIDSIDASSGWFSGNNSTKQTMERISNASGTETNWANNNLVTKNGLDADGNPINGTPKAENSVAKSSTDIIGGLNITDDFVLTSLGSPYLVEGSITVETGAKLTIEPGVTIKFKHHYAWKSALNVNGSFEAIGGDDPEQKIIFTSFKDATGTDPAAGDWEWLYLKGPQNNLKNVVVKYAGKREGNPPENPLFTRGAIQIDGGQGTIENLLIEESQTLGLWIKDSANISIAASEFRGIDTSWPKPAAIYIENGSSTITNSTFENNNIGILVENFASSTIKNNVFEENQTPIKINTLLPIISDNTFSNNNYNGIYLDSLTYIEGQTLMAWPKTNAPYIINTLNLAYGLTLQVESGVMIKFLNNGRLNIEGSFEAVGAADDKITFTSIQDDEYGGDTNNDGGITQPAAGRWHYIYFSASSTDSVMENAIIRYGGWYNVFQGGADAKSGAVKTKSASLAIRNSLFENNFFAGLQLANATTTIENVSFNKNERGIYIETDSGACPDLSEVTFGEGENANTADVFPSNCAP